MTKRDYYEVLNIDKTIDNYNIWKAYFELANKWHPDVNTDSAQYADKKYREIHEAYKVLIDKEKRQQYDNYGHDGLRKMYQDKFQYIFKLEISDELFELGLTNFLNGIF